MQFIIESENEYLEIETGFPCYETKEKWKTNGLRKKRKLYSLTSLKEDMNSTRAMITAGCRSSLFDVTSSCIKWRQQRRRIPLKRRKILSLLKFSNVSLGGCNC